MVGVLACRCIHGKIEASARDFALKIRDARGIQLAGHEQDLVRRTCPSPALSVSDEPLFHNLKRWWGANNLWQQERIVLELWMQICSATLRKMNWLSCLSNITMQTLCKNRHDLSHAKARYL